jgi:uncharacterized protein
MARFSRRALLGLGIGAVACPLTQAIAQPEQVRLAFAWRGPSESDAHHIGVMSIERDARQAVITQRLPVPSRAHGFAALPDGGYIAVANRPGTWLWRIDRAGQVAARAEAAPDSLQRFSGHVAVTMDGQHLLSTETRWAEDPRDHTGWVVCRRVGDLAEVERWPSGGRDPHDLLITLDGSCWVANGGLVRDRQGRKWPGADVESSLCRLDVRSGAIKGRWSLADPALSMRHLAHDPSADGPSIGVALQAEHPDPLQRRVAPTLAVWSEAGGLVVQPVEASLQGHAGDIVPTPGGGYAESHAQVGRAARWQGASTGNPWATLAQLSQASAMACDTPAGGLWIASARGLAWWHPREAPWMAPWPEALAADNHWRELLGG